MNLKQLKAIEDYFKGKALLGYLLPTNKMARKKWGIEFSDGSFFEYHPQSKILVLNGEITIK